MLRIKVDISKSNDGHAEIEYDSYRKDYEIIVHATHDTDLQEFFSDRKKLASMIAETSERQFDEFASTGDDDLINQEEKGDLEYRRAQLKRLQEEVVYLERNLGRPPSRIACCPMFLSAHADNLPHPTKSFLAVWLG